MRFLALFIGLNLAAAEGKYKLGQKCNVWKKTFFGKLSQKCWKI